MGILAIDSGSISIALFAFIALLTVTFFSLFPLGMWMKALTSNAKIDMGVLVAMRLRKVNVKLIVNAYISAVNAGIAMDVKELETHHLAGGDVNKVVKGMIYAQGVGISLSLQNAKALDLVGSDIVECVDAELLKQEL